MSAPAGSADDWWRWRGGQETHSGDLDRRVKEQGDQVDVLNGGVSILEAHRFDIDRRLDDHGAQLRELAVGINRFGRDLAAVKARVAVLAGVGSVAGSVLAGIIGHYVR